MPISNVFEYLTTAASNTDAGGVNIAEGMAPSGVNNSIRTIMSHIAAMVDDWGGANATTGSSNTYALTTASTWAEYADGYSATIRPNFTNTGDATLNVDGLGAKALRKYAPGGAVPLDSGDMLAGGRYWVYYDASNDHFVVTGTLTRRPFDTREEFVAWTANGSVANGSVVSAGGFLYEADDSVTDISDLSGWKPYGFIAPQHFGAYPTTATAANRTALTAMWTYATGLTSPPGAARPQDDQLPVFFPAGRWRVNSGGGPLVFRAEGANFLSVFGEGAETELESMCFHFAYGSAWCQVRDLTLTGTAYNALVSTTESEAATRENGEYAPFRIWAYNGADYLYVSNVNATQTSITDSASDDLLNDVFFMLGNPWDERRDDKVFGTRVENCRVEGLFTGFWQYDTSDANVEGCSFEQCRMYGIRSNGGGQCKWYRNNVRGTGTGNTTHPDGGWIGCFIEGFDTEGIVGGKDQGGVVEHQWIGNTFSEGAPGGRQYRIRTITESPVFSGKIRVTVAAPHMMNDTFQDAGIMESPEAGAATTAYATTATSPPGVPEEVVLGVYSTDADGSLVLDLDIDYTADEDFTSDAAIDRPRLYSRPWDLWVCANELGRSVNDQFFIGGNINHVRVSGGLNIRFDKVRVKEAIYLERANGSDGSQESHWPSDIIIDTGRGRGAASGNPGTQYLEAYGPAANRGHARIGQRRISGSTAWYQGNDVATGLWVPNRSAGITQAGYAALYNGIGATEDRTETSGPAIVNQIASGTFASNTSNLTLDIPSWARAVEGIIWGWQQDDSDASQRLVLTLGTGTAASPTLTTSGYELNELSWGAAAPASNNFTSQASIFLTSAATTSSVENQVRFRITGVSVGTGQTVMSESMTGIFSSGGFAQSRISGHCAITNPTVLRIEAAGANIDAGSYRIWGIP